MMDASAQLDPRHIANGWEIPNESYCDQPYVVKTRDGAWLCVMTTGTGREGEGGQHVISVRSVDQGRTWEAPVAIEPADGPEASYAVALTVPSGRVYAFYNHNTDNIRRVKVPDGSAADGYCYRVDSLGYYVFKFSDDNGHSWSETRYPIPVREFEIDRENVYGGKIRFFWNVGRPFTRAGNTYVPLHKVGNFGHGFFIRNEGVLLRSDNILTERDPANIRWETLPDGDVGLRTPAGGGPISAEHSFSALSDGSFFVVYRSIDGHPVFSYSRDGGHTWDAPQYMRYADGRLIKHPRAANFAWRCANERFIYWYHNHGGRWYNDRNPVWILGGIEIDSPDGKLIQWSQPEIMLYDDDMDTRMSYPDLIEEDGQYYVTETQKEIARVHLISHQLFDAVWNQFKANGVTGPGKALDLRAPLPTEVAMPAIPEFRGIDASSPSRKYMNLRTGFSVDLWVRFDDLDTGQVLLDNRTENGEGWWLRVTDSATIEIVINDGRHHSSWDCDRQTLTPGVWHHVGIVVDAGPRIICFIVDGQFCDGAEYRQFGFGRFSAFLTHAKGADTLRIAPALHGELRALRIYDRALLTSEIISNYRAG
jgi:hypothetical protein